MRGNRRLKGIVVFTLTVGLILISTGQVGAAKTCYDCHKQQKEQYSAYKAQHKPVKDENCESCHKRHGFAQQLILKDNTSELCYGCHADLHVKYSVGDVHFPVEKGKCWDCHDPHGGNTTAMLRTPPTDADLDNFCLLCHKDAFDKDISKKVLHAPFEQAECLTCHAAHNSAHAGLLVSEGKTLCGSCHDLADAGFVQGHKERNAGDLPCSNCHSAHASDDKGLLATNTHAPFAGGECEICHSLPDEAGKVTFYDGVAPGQVCATCHDDKVEMVSASHPHPAVEADNCDNCHNSHSSRYPSLLKSDQGSLCGECHADVLTGGDRKAHLPVAVGECGSCHEVHGSESASLLKSDGAELCLGCHSDFATKRDNSAHQHAAIDNCLGCHSPHEGFEAGILRVSSQQLCAECHDVDRAALNAASGHQPYLTGSCASCHVPHFSDAAHLVRGGAEMCLTCHADIGKRVNMSVPHAPAVDDCSGCHAPHYSENLQLMTSSQKEMCGSCHDYDELNISKKHAHTPAREGDCTGCHNPHGGEQAKLVTGRMVKVDVGGLKVGQLPKLTGKTSDLCYTCHEDLAEKFRKQGTHAPVAEGSCDACHAAHGSDHAGFVLAAAPELCESCHAVDADLAALHGGYDLTSADCLGCHNPHVSEQSKLVRNMMHPPFEEKSCDACHELGEDGKAVMTAGAEDLCGACHETVTENMELAHQHAPFAGEECDGCHGVHAAEHKNLLKAEGEALCESCHEDIPEQRASLSVKHEPFEKGLCLDCHRPHASAYAALAPRPAESFCLGCHTDLKAEIDAGAPHAPVVDGDCQACHAAHGGNLTAMLVQPKQELCGGCHDLTARETRVAHRGFDLKGVDCQNCHAAHAGPAGSKGLLLPDSHAPFADGDCTSCHEGLRANMFIASGNRLCFNCHDDFLAAASKAVIHAPLQQQDGCTACHGPHVGYGAALQLKDGIQTCLTCHNDAEFKGENKHSVAFEDCGNCHQPHTSNYESLLSTADVMELCTACHDNAVETHYHPMGIGVTDPRTKQPLNCVGCHSPHSSDYTAMLVAEKDRKLCILCHTVSQ